MFEPAPLVVFADDWGRHPSSCQHLIRRLRDDRLVVWVNTIGTRQVKADGVTLRRGVEKLRNWARGVARVGEQMWVVDLPMLPGLRGPLLRGFNRALVQVRLRQVLSRLGVIKPVVITTLPYIGWLADGLSRRGLIYYCTDDYSHWPSADRGTLQGAERDLLKKCDLVLAASQALAERLRPTARCCEYFPHGVDFEHFASARLRTPEPALANLPGPRIGFFGLIYEKLNFEMLAAVARRFPSGTLAMIGPVDRCPAEFAALPNVKLLGRRPYAELPAAIAGLDVLLLPYVDDAMIRQSGPLKLRECLATGLPTVSVDVPEVRLLRPHVRVASDNEAFVSEVAEALREGRNTPISVARQDAVRADGWDHRADTLRQHLASLATAPTRESNPRRRVLHLRTVSGRGGGPEKTLLNNPRFLGDGYDVRLAYVRPLADPEYDMPRRAEALGVRLADIPERSGADPRTLWHLAREIARFRPHLLHAHDYKTNVLGVVLAKLFRIPVMTTLHGYVTRGGRLELYYLADRVALPLMDHVVSVSPDLDRQAGTTRVPDRRRSMLENGIDTDDFRRGMNPASAKSRLGLNPDQLVIGAVGRLAPEKGFDVLIRATTILARANNDVLLLIAGTGAEEASLRKLAQELGVADRVRLLGHLSDPRILFEAMDVFVLSSYREGLPNVLLEAMALEVPVVATRVNGVPRLVHDGVNGVLVEAGSHDALADAIGGLFRDCETRARLAAAGRATVINGYSFAKRMSMMRRVYDGVLGGGSASRRRVS